MPRKLGLGYYGIYGDTIMTKLKDGDLISLAAADAMPENATSSYCVVIFRPETRRLFFIRGSRKDDKYLIFGKMTREQAEWFLRDIAFLIGMICGFDVKVDPTRKRRGLSVYKFVK